MKEMLKKKHSNIEKSEVNLLSDADTQQREGHKSKSSMTKQSSLA